MAVFLKLLLLFFFTGLITPPLFAEVSLTVNCTIKNINQSNTEGCIVRISAVSAKLPVEMIGVSDSLGKVTFKNWRSSEFRVEVTHLGFKPFNAIYEFSQQSGDISLPVIWLVKDTVQLRNHEVSGGSPAILFKGDTIEYKADSFFVRPNADVEDLLKRLPGIAVQKDGSIITQGRVVTKIRVNGKDFFPGDVKMATQNIPAKIVDKIQVIDDYGEDGALVGFKNTDVNKVINITLKKDYHKGYFLKAENGVGTHSTYNSRNVLNYFGGSSQATLYTNNNNINTILLPPPSQPFYGTLTSLLRMNNAILEDAGGGKSVASLVSNQDMGFLNASLKEPYGITNEHSFGARYSYDPGKKIKVYSSMIYFNNHIQTQKEGDILYLYANTAPTQHSSKNRIKNISGFRSFTNIEVKPDSVSIIKINTTISNNANMFDVREIRIFFLTDSLGNGLSNDSQNDVNHNSYIIDGIYKRSFKQSGVLIFSVSTGRYFDRSNANVTNQLGLNPVNGHMIQSNKSKFLTTYTRTRLGYQINLFRKLSIDVYGEYLDNSSVNDRYNSTSYFSEDCNYNGYYSGTVDQHSIYKTVNINAKLELRKSEFTFGALYQRTDSKRNYDHVGFLDTINSALLPNGYVSYKFSRTNMLVLKANSMVRLPNAYQLSPIADSTDPFHSITGNPKLNPELVRSVNLTYTKYNIINGSLFLFGVEYRNTDNKIMPQINLLKDGKMSSTLLNIPYFRDFAFYYNCSMPFKNKTYEVGWGGMLLNSSSLYPDAIFYKSAVRKIDEHVSFSVYRTFLELNSTIHFNYLQLKFDKQRRNALSLQLHQNITIYNGKNKAGVDITYQEPRGFLQKKKDILIIDMYVERELNNRLYLRLNAYDLFDRTKFNINFDLKGNSVADNTYNTLGKTIFFTAVYKFNTFH